MTIDATPRIAVLVPCYNEAIAIAKVIVDFRAALPQAEICVIDNNSTDDTAAIARGLGARVQSVNLQGKGHVVRRLFADVDADYYVLVDGDDTYDAASSPALLQHAREGRFDMVVAVRHATDAAAAYRFGHAWGNRMLTGFLAWLFGRPCKDILSGYRVFSRRFVKSFPVLSEGFEIETELTVHAMELKMPVGEIDTPYGERPEGSVSKLSTYKDGFRILRTMLRLFSAERPVAFYTFIAVVLAVAANLIALPLFFTYLETGLVPRFPTAVLTTGMMVLAAMSFVAGLVLDTVTRGRRELKMLAYLRESAPF